MNKKNGRPKTESAEQTCQKMLTASLRKKERNINNPSTHFHLSSLLLSLSFFVNYSTRYCCITTHSRACPLRFLAAASTQFRPSLQPLALYKTLFYPYNCPKNMNIGNNFMCTPGLFIFFLFHQQPSPQTLYFS